MPETTQNMNGKSLEPPTRAETAPHANGRATGDPPSRRSGASGGSKTSRSRSNGHAAANGAAAASVERGEAASDAAGELSVANAAGTSAAGADRQADADAASAPSEPKPADASQDEPKKIPPGTTPLPIDGEAFVDAVHSHVDLIKTEVKLLQSKDEKVVQRELAYLRELRYGKRASSDGEHPTQIIFDSLGLEGDKP
jgi:hypothetical protein